MTLPNHLAGGFVFTGIFGSIVGVNILEKPVYLIVVLFASMLPDVDHTKSLIGKIFFPISKWLNRMYGHRTITHTFLFLFASTLLVSLIFNDKNITIVFFLAFFSHLLFDMMTIQGVPLFFPFYRNPCVIPGNPDKRFRTGNRRTETMMFSIFLLIGLFCQPLMENGFWMQYNRSFGTLKHLTKQFQVTENILHVKYSYRNGSEEIQGEGYCIETSENEAILLNTSNSRFEKITSDLTSLNVFPSHTNLRLKFKTESFINASILDVDSLMRHGSSKSLLKNCIINSNIPFQTSVNGIHKVVENYNEDYPNNFEILEIPKEKIEPFKYNPRTNQLSKIINQKRQLETIKQENYKEQLQQLENLYNELETADLSNKEILIKEIKRFERSIKKPVSKEAEIKELEFELSTLHQSEAIERQIYNQENRTEKLKLTGTLTKIIIE